jgi:hypothetical protein
VTDQPADRTTVVEPVPQGRAEAKRTNVWGFLTSRNLHGTGTVVVVVVAMLIVLGITVVAIAGGVTNDETALVTAAFTVIGTLVGAYTGARIGSRGADEARADAEEASIKTAELAAACPDPVVAQRALDRAETKIAMRREAPPRPRS